MQYRANIPEPLVSPVLQRNYPILCTYMCKDRSLHMINMIINFPRHKESRQGLLCDRRDSIHYTTTNQIKVRLLLVVNVKYIHYHSINKHNDLVMNFTNMLYSVPAYMIV